MNKTNNPVAKHAKTFNKAHVMKDRKKAMKRGAIKHKGKAYEENDVVEGEKGLWDRIRAKKKRGESPAKPGDKDYPKTLDVESKNTPDDGNPCWDTHKKVGTKMKNGKRVNDCVPKNESMDPRDFTDKAGYVVVVKNNKGQEEIKHYSPYKPHAERYAKRVHKGPDKATVYKTDGRKIMKEGKATLFNFGVYDKAGKLKGASSSEKDAKSHAFRIKGKVVKFPKPMKDRDIDKMMVMQEGSMELAMPDYPEQDKMKVKFAKKEDTMSRARETKRLKDKHSREREQEKAAAKRVTSSTTSTGNRSVSVTRTRSEQIISKHTDENLVEELTALEKRKYMNLKKRAKAGDRTAKKNLDAFEKANADAIRVGKGSAAKSKKGNNTKKGAADPHSGAGYSGKASEKGSDDHIIMQLRKAQDVKGNMDIKVTPTGKTVRVPLSLINKVLDRHDRMTKPDEKRKLRVLLTKELRKKAK